MNNIYIWYSYQKWCTDYRDNPNKKDRWDVESPSNAARPPRPKIALGNSNSARNNNENNKNAPLQSGSFRQDNPVTKTSSHRSVTTNFLCNQHDKQGKPCLLSDARSTNMHMNHIRLNFLQYLWGMYFLWPNSVILGVVGLVGLALKKKSLHRGLPTYNYAEEVAKQCLKSMQIAYYRSKETIIDATVEYEVASFVWDDFVMLNNQGEVWTAKTLVVKIELGTQPKMIFAYLDNEELTTEETFVLLCSGFNSHVISHSYSNWGVNIHPTTHWYVRRIGVATVLYNHFGAHSFSKIAMQWEKLGFATHKNLGSVQKLIDIAAKESIVYHGQLHEILQHSKLATFIMKIRPIFFREFMKYRQTDLRGIDPEAFFVGTIIRSLDHTTYSHNTPDCLSLQKAVGSKYGLMAELCTIACVGFMDDTPFKLFASKFRDASHPFFRTVYQRATKIDQEIGSHFADKMDTCICK
jgi:hypothetical protein